MNMNSLKKSISHTLKKSFTTIKYGDEFRKPLEYRATHTSSPPFIGEFPHLDEFEVREKLFPQFSKELLIELFSKIGVEYIPEVTLYELEQNDPLEVFYRFVITFGVKVEDRLEQSYYVDATLLNRVIGYLREMDRLRAEESFDSRAIYRLLAHQNFDKVEKILKKRG